MTVNHNNPVTIYKPKYGRMAHYWLQSNGKIEERRTKVSEMYFHEDKSVAEIALELGVSKNTIYKDIDSIRFEMYESRTWNAQKHINRQLSIYDRVEEEAWEAWYRSIGQTVKAKKKWDGSGILIEVENVEEEAVGDPRFLTQIQQIGEKRAKLLGLDAPQHIVVDSMETRLIALIQEGKVNYDMLVSDVGHDVARRFYNLAGKRVPKMIEAEIEEVTYDELETVEEYE
jgi:predicted DNA-binding protein YlxM (UPF0122 family)